MNYIGHLNEFQLNEFLSGVDTKCLSRQKKDLPSLQNCCISKLIKCYNYFIMTSKKFGFIKPLDNIPNSVIQEILYMLAVMQQKNKRKKVPRHRFAREFIILLLNQNVTYFNFMDFPWLSDYDTQLIYNHLITNCPKILKMEKPAFRLARSSNCITLEMLQPRDLCCWKNLREAKCADFPLSGFMLQKVQKHLHHLVVFEFALANGNISLEELNCMREMSSLRQVIVNTTEYCSLSDQKLVAYIAGLPPNLEKFGSNLLQSEDSVGLNIIKYIGKNVPEKLLVLKNVTIVRAHLEHRWQKNLCVENLEIIGSPGLNFNEFVSRILAPAVKKIVFDSVLPHDINLILNHFGDHLNELEIVMRKGSLCRRFAEKLDLYKIFSAVPQLQKFLFLAPYHLEGQRPCAGLTPQHFSKITSFEIPFVNGDGSQCAIKELIKLVLLGANNYKILKLHTKYDEMAALELLREQPECMDKIVEVHVHDNITLNEQLAKILVSLVMLPSSALQKLIWDNSFSMTLNNFCKIDKDIFQFLLKAKVQIVMKSPCSL